MRWAEHKELSESDMEYLVGSAVVIEMMRHKLIVKFHDREKPAKPSEMGLRDCKGLYHIRQIDENDKLLEILFELPEDRDAVEQHLTQYKMALD